MNAKVVKDLKILVAIIISCQCHQTHADEHPTRKTVHETYTMHATVNVKS